jgi:hypothetical protein
MHSKEGARRQLRQQMRIVKVLREAGFTVDEECHIAYKGCVNDADRHHARLDMYVVNITECIVIVEVDEKAHVHYEVRCEQTRMLQMHEALLSQGCDLPVVFVRYNPDGKVTREGVAVRITRDQREAALIAYLDEVVAGTVAFTEPFNTVYLFYPTEDELPTVVADPEYDLDMIGAIRFCM